MDDKLDLIFEVQTRLQKRLNSPIGDMESTPRNMRSKRDKDRMPFITEMTLAAIVELGEFIQEMPWKSWKKNQGADLEAAILELVDAQHFIINLALALGMTAEEFFNAYMLKHAENVRRQDAGY